MKLNCVNKTIVVDSAFMSLELSIKQFDVVANTPSGEELYPSILTVATIRYFGEDVFVGATVKSKDDPETLEGQRKAIKLAIRRAIDVSFDEELAFFDKGEREDFWLRANEAFGLW